jgi:hypothetical protein
MKSHFRSITDGSGLWVVTIGSSGFVVIFSRGGVKPGREAMEHRTRNIEGSDTAAHAVVLVLGLGLGLEKTEPTTR